MSSDFELLRRYAAHQAEDAFAELTRRHLNLVYSAALRQVRSPQLAEEIAQSVFIDLARDAARLQPDTVLTAWLYRVACRTAIDVVRRESRRQRREQLAQEITAMNADIADWSRIEPLLDEAMNTLEEVDRAAVLLRYFEGKNLREVGQALGSSEDAAQKRVSRAVDRLREFFSRHGVAVGAAALIAIVSANAIQAAPAGLAAAIAGAVLTAAPCTGVIVTATKTIAMTTLQKSIAAAAVIAAIGTGIYQAQRAADLRSQAAALQERQKPLVAQILQLTQERKDADRKIAALLAENAQMSRGRSNLYTLRAEVSRLRAATNELGHINTNDAAFAAASAWNDRVKKLKERMAATPSAQIPELKFITENNWLDAAHGNLNSDDDYRRAFASLRAAGENQFIIEMQGALSKYLAANNNVFPTDLSQISQYLKTPDDAVMLNRYGILAASDVPNLSMGGDKIITVANPVDPQYDTFWGIGPNGFGNTGAYQNTADEIALAPALKAYKADHNGHSPTDPSQIVPYLTTPALQSAYADLQAKRDPNQP